MVPGDAAAVLGIYQAALDGGDASFETTAPDWAAFDAGRLAAHRWVAEAGDAVLGWVAVTRVSPRPVYAGVVEHSIYVDAAAQGRGVGRVLLAELLSRCEALGARQMLAVIGDAANGGSVGVHRALGFEHTGVLKAAGWKFGAWLDVVLMQRALGFGDREPGEPDAGGDGPAA
jgi:phosphinothricin acetyltransferase